MIREAISPPLLTLLVILIFNCLLMLLPVPSRSDPSCPDLKSAPCGNVNISYPFWCSNDPNEEESPYCGYQSFTLTCSSGIPILRLGHYNYSVLDIQYNDTSVSLVDDNRAADTCSTVSQSVTWPSNISLSSGDNQINLTLFFNCSPFNTWSSEVITCFRFNKLEREIEYSYYLDVEIPDGYDCSAEVVPSVLESYVGKELAEEYAQILGDGLKFHGMRDTNENCPYCKSSGGRCAYNTTDNAPICFCSGGKIEVPQHAESPPANTERPLENLPANTESPPANTERPLAGARRSPAPAPAPAPAGRKKRMIIGIVIGTMVGFILACFISSYLLCFREPNEKKDQAIQDFILQYESTTPKRYTYTEIKRMTKSFSDKLGNGGYGSVFKGSLQDGHLVAVKILNETQGNGEDFINEVASISRTSHVNIVALLGFCLEGSKRALVYEFMSNGSLDKYIFYDKSNTQNGKLSWEKLYDIAIAIARGLEYLHRGCNTRIVHFDIKPHNILLDQDFCPKISDFGLAKMCKQKDSIISTMAMRGTPGYIAPELFSRSFGTISSKSDVYSYGMMVLEMIGGRKNFNARADHTSETYFPDWVYDNLDDYCNLTDSASASEVSSKTREIERKMIIVGLWCIQIKPENRPSISMVVDMLEGSISVLQMPPKPEFS